MRNYLLTTFLSVVFVLSISCSGKNKSAKDYLSEAQQSYQSGNYSLAKLKIDSIQLLFPKAFDEINKGFALMQDVRMAENKRNIAFCDSMLTVSYRNLKEMLTKFTYVRDARYQEFGEYHPIIYPQNAVFSQNGLRSGVSEQGALFIESVVSGSNIRHYKVKVATNDGNFAETLSVTSDGLNYRFSTLSNSYEIVRYRGSDENGIANFIFTFQNQPLTVSFIGNRTASAVLSDAAKKGISQSFELSSLLLEIEKLKLEKGKSETLIRYLESRKK